MLGGGFRALLALCGVFVLVSAGVLAPARAQVEPEADGAGLGARATATPASAPASASDATSSVTQAQMQERLPRSAPDALRYEPGVSVQQTAHGQASPYVRGMTGQQVLHAFDGIRMNNGLYRQGPNQYFFTVDSYTLDRIDVVRGSASTRYGSDALGGAILAQPREPWLSRYDGGALELHPRVYGRLATADWERGGRAELELTLPDFTGVLLGVGHRTTDRLQAGGVVQNDGLPRPLVPRFEDDGRTQLGTGFTETTFDARVVRAVTPQLRLITALYGYRQSDSPRTDQCPPPEAPRDECLRVAQQFRTLGYLALRGDAGRQLRELDLSVSVQRHDERRVRERPRSFVHNDYDDGVYTLGVSARGASRALPIAPGASLRVRAGAEAYRDSVSSSAEQELTDPALVAIVAPERLRTVYSRGQYVQGSTFLQTGAFSELELRPLEGLLLYGGGRIAAAAANAPPDASSGTAAVNERWTAGVGRAGVRARVAPGTDVQLGFDQGFRVPNLDDLTSRQQVGPGFQFENAALQPERTNTLELGASTAQSWLTLDAWLFATWIDDSITRALREAEDCPPETEACRASRTRLQLVNADGTAFLWGTEGGATATFTEGLTLRATYGYAWGEGPDPRNEDSARRTPRRVPLSRVPPPNGTVELRYRDLAAGWYVALASRWALPQRRLAPSDLSDARIPVGGTPGYALADLRAGYRYAPYLSFSLVLENVLDAAYRVHGSSINGPGRGLLLGAVLSY